MGTANITFGHQNAKNARNQTNLFMPDGASANLTTNASTATPSVASAAAEDGSGREHAVRVIIDEIAYIRVDGSTAAVGTGMQLQPLIEYIFAVPHGTSVSIIDAA